MKVELQILLNIALVIIIIAQIRWNFLQQQINKLQSKWNEEQQNINQVVYKRCGVKK